MFNFLRMMGMREFPWGTAGVWLVLGIFAAMGIRFMLWRNTEPGLHINLDLALVGALIGGILGLCYHVVAQHCGLTLSG